MDIWVGTKALGGRVGDVTCDRSIREGKPTPRQLGGWDPHLVKVGFGLGAPFFCHKKPIWKGKNPT